MHVIKIQRSEPSLKTCGPRHRIANRFWFGNEVASRVKRIVQRVKHKQSYNFAINANRSNEMQSKRELNCNSPKMCNSHSQSIEIYIWSLIFEIETNLHVRIFRAQLSDLIFITLALHILNNELADKQNLKDQFFFWFMPKSPRKKNQQCEAKQRNKNDTEKRAKEERNKKQMKNHIESLLKWLAGKVIRYSRGIQSGEYYGEKKANILRIWNVQCDPWNGVISICNSASPICVVLFWSLLILFALRKNCAVHVSFVGSNDDDGGGGSISSLAISINTVVRIGMSVIAYVTAHAHTK